MEEKISKWLEEALSKEWIWLLRDGLLMKADDINNFPLDLQSELDDVLGYGGIEKDKRSVKVEYYGNDIDGLVIASINWVDSTGKLHSIMENLYGHRATCRTLSDICGRYYDD